MKPNLLEEMEEDSIWDRNIYVRTGLDTHVKTFALQVGVVDIGTTRQIIVEKCSCMIAIHV